MIRFTTEAPQSYVSPLEVLDDNIPVEFRITEMYPNPFNPKINFTVRINSTNSVSINIIDIIERINILMDRWIYIYIYIYIYM